MKITDTTGSCAIKKVIELPPPPQCQPLLSVLKKDVFERCALKKQ